MNNGQNGHNNLIVNARGDMRAAASPDLQRLQLQVNQMTIQLSRMQLARAMGQTHDGRRDTWKVFGYPDEITVDDYYNWYRRGGMAKRIINLPPQDTWKDGLILVDGDEQSTDDMPASPFLKAWKSLDKRLRITHNFRRLDRLARVGRFGVMLIGAVGGQQESLEQPVQRVRDIAYLRVYREGLANIQDKDLDTDPTTPHFGKPNFYEIKFGAGGQAARVHYSRVIHVAEDPLDDDVFGTPPLEAPFNRLIDKEKVVGGGAEAFWLLVHRGLAVIGEEGFTDDPAELEAFQAQVDSYAHGLTRIMRLVNAKIQELGGDVADPGDPYDVILSEISASTGIPKRKLVGTEEGRLAGAQDERAWNDLIDDRRREHAGPMIVTPFIDWCLARGVLPQPTSGEYGVEWPSPFQLTEPEVAEIAASIAQAIKDYCGMSIDPALVMPPGVFAERYLGYTMPATEAELLDQEDDDLQDSDNQDDDPDAETDAEEDSE